MIGILNIAQQAYSRYSHPPRAIPASLFMRNEEFGLATKDGDGNYIYTNIPFDLLIDESHELDFDITDHAVENGSTISDHVQQRLRTVKITGMFTNHPLNASAGFVAAAMKQKAEIEIEREKKRALNDAKNEISEIAMAIAGKVVGRELTAEDHAKMVDSFIDELGGEV